MKDLTEAGIVLGEDGIPLLKMEVTETTMVTEDVGTEGLDCEGLRDDEIAARLELDSPAEVQHEAQDIADIPVRADVCDLVDGCLTDSISNNYNDDIGSNSANDDNRKRKLSGDGDLERVLERAVDCSTSNAAALLPYIIYMGQISDDVSETIGHNSAATLHVDHEPDPVSDSSSNIDTTTPVTDEKEELKSSSVRISFHSPDGILRIVPPSTPDSNLLMSDRCLGSRSALSSSVSSSSSSSTFALSSSSAVYGTDCEVSGTIDRVNSNNCNRDGSTNDSTDDNRDSSSGITDNNDGTSNEFSGTDDDSKDNCSNNVDNECSSGTSTETDDDCLLPHTYYKHVEPRTHNIDLLKTIIKNSTDSGVPTDSNREVFVST